MKCLWFLVIILKCPLLYWPLFFLFYSSLYPKELGVTIIWRQRQEVAENDRKIPKKSHINPYYFYCFHKFHRLCIWCYFEHRKLLEIAENGCQVPKTAGNQQIQTTARNRCLFVMSSESLDEYSWSCRDMLRITRKKSWFTFLSHSIPEG